MAEPLPGPAPYGCHSERLQMRGLGAAAGWRRAGSLETRYSQVAGTTTSWSCFQAPDRKPNRLRAPGRIDEHGTTNGLTRFLDRELGARASAAGPMISSTRVMILNSNRTIW